MISRFPLYFDLHSTVTVIHIITIKKDFHQINKSSTQRVISRFPLYFDIHSTVTAIHIITIKNDLHQINKSSFGTKDQATTIGCQSFDWLTASFYLSPSNDKFYTSRCYFINTIPHSRHILFSVYIICFYPQYLPPH